jgi:hypothetical protein
MRIQSFPAHQAARVGAAGIALAGFLVVSGVGDASAHSDAVAAGNGGTARSGANGGSILIDDVNSGWNGGSLILVGDIWNGSLAIDGGGVGSATNLAVGANGGVGISDSTGGDDNLVFDND